MSFDCSALPQAQAQIYKNIQDAYEKNYNYTLGTVTFRGEREIDAPNMYTKFDNVIGDIVDISNGDKKLIDPMTMKSDGKIGDFEQGERGDCYFLSALKALSLTNNGKKIIKNSIKDNKDGSYTVTLPGALKLKEQMQNNGVDDCKITGVYRISAGALKRAVNSPDYSTGDKDVVIMELAMEAYNAEVDKNARELGIDNADHVLSGSRLSEDNKDVLSGGLCQDAMFVLTGRQSEIYDVFLDENKQEPQADVMELASSDDDIELHESENTNYHKDKLVKNYSLRAENDEELNMFLDDCIGKEKRYAMTAGFKVDEDGNLLDRNAEAEGHALCIKRVTKDKVELINPWDTSKTKVVSREEFIQKVRAFSRTDMN